MSMPLWKNEELLPIREHCSGAYSVVTSLFSYIPLLLTILKYKTQFFFSIRENCVCLSVIYITNEYSQVSAWQSQVDSVKIVHLGLALTTEKVSCGS